jgi:hypothetical protein
VKLFDIADYLEDKFDDLKKSAGRSGDERTASCPSCGKSGKWYINAETGRHICFSCGFAGRSIVSLIAYLENWSQAEAASYVFRNSVELRRAESRESLAERIRSLRSDKAEQPEDSKEIDFGLPKGVRLVYDENRARTWELPQYLKKRKIKSGTARAWGLGYCSRIEMDWPGRDRPVVIRDRLFIPIVCPSGRSWTARDMTEKQTPKYLNPPGADHKYLLIGWDLIRFAGEICLVEGPTDALRFYQHRIPALALGGKVLHDEQMALLLDLPSDANIVVMLDPGEDKHAHEAALKLSTHFKNIFIGQLPDGVDPGKSTLLQANEAVERAKRWTGSRLSSTSSKVLSSRKLLSGRYGIT